MTWFSVPEGYSCVVRQNDTTLYGYVSNRRDVYTLNGLVWQKTSTSTNTSLPSNTICVTGSQIPASFLTGGLVSATLLVLGTFSIIARMIRRTYL